MPSRLHTPVRPRHNRGVPEEGFSGVRQGGLLAGHAADNGEDLSFGDRAL